MSDPVPETAPAAESLPEVVGSVAVVATPQASRHLQQLCKHFAHKRPVAFDAHTGSIAFAIGTCRLAADESTLTMRLGAPGDAELLQLQDVVERHLLRFAFREEMAIEWRPA